MQFWIHDRFYKVLLLLCSQTNRGGQRSNNAPFSNLFFTSWQGQLLMRGLRPWVDTRKRQTKNLLLIVLQRRRLPRLIPQQARCVVTQIVDIFLHHQPDFGPRYFKHLATKARPLRRNVSRFFFTQGHWLVSCPGPALGSRSTERWPIMHLLSLATEPQRWEVGLCLWRGVHGRISSKSQRWHLQADLHQWHTRCTSSSNDVKTSLGKRVVSFNVFLFN